MVVVGAVNQDPLIAFFALPVIIIGFLLYGAAKAKVDRQLVEIAQSAIGAGGPVPPIGVCRELFQRAALEHPGEGMNYYPAYCRAWALTHEY